MKKKMMILTLMFSLIVVTGCKLTVDTEETTTVTITTTENTSGTTTEDSMETTITGPVTIEFWHAFGEDKGELLAEIIKDFTDANPNVTVNLLSQGDYNGLRDKTIQSIVTGNTPTMLIGYPDHVADYLTGNAVVSLDPYINNAEIGFSQAELDDFVQAYLQENRQFGGATYGLPFNKSTEVFIYNKTYFESKVCKTGFDKVTDLYDIVKTEIPNYDATYITAHPELANMDTSCLTPIVEGASRVVTWELVKEASAEIKVDKNAYGFAYDSLANMFITLTRQWGGQYTGSNGQLLFENQQAIDMLTYYNTQKTAGLFTIPAEWEQNYASTPFTNGQVFMTVGSTAGATYNVPANGSFDIGIAPIPQKADATKAVIQQGTNISIMANGTEQQKLAAWLLTKHLTSVEATID